jgi:hypothetical protein
MHRSQPSNQSTGDKSTDFEGEKVKQAPMRALLVELW